ncbi:trypsin-3-like [Acanthochromis polyacanthus]|uniref:trypsin-3-like n=1 Tax=Acanthochromis polyacanthus TaxID=80966 RepID=UPI00223415DC|nr:trypsin-3-like [Acanthochromis polyacanthus]
MKYFIFLALFAATYAAPVQDDKIVGGYECRKNSVPYQVYLNTGYRFCGGALISRTWVVSAGRCSWSSMKVHLGEHDLGVDEGTEQIIDAEKIIDHPRYTLYHNDIMLVKLSKPATLNNYVRTVSLPTSCAVTGTKCLTSGWGLTCNFESQSNTENISGKYFGERYGTVSDRLRCLDVPILSDTNCDSSWPYQFTSNMFCAESLEEYEDSCEGEFGAPLVCNGQLQGLLSWGFYSENMPEVYTKVCKYTSWIRGIMMSE